MSQLVQHSVGSFMFGLFMLTAACKGDPAGITSGEAASLVEEASTTSLPDCCKDLKTWLRVKDRGISARTENVLGKWELIFRPSLISACMRYPDAHFSSKELRLAMIEQDSTSLYELRYWPGPEQQSTALFTEEGMNMVKQVSGRDTIPCAFIHVEALPPTLTYRSALIGFDALPADRTRSVIIELDEDGVRTSLNFMFPKGISQSFSAMTDTSKTDRS